MTLPFVSKNDLKPVNTQDLPFVSKNSLESLPFVSKDDLVNKSSLGYVASHPSELGKDMLLGLVGTRDKADWEHPLNYLSPWANAEEAGAPSINNAQVAQKVGDAAVGIAAAVATDGLASPFADSLISTDGVLPWIGKQAITNAAGSLAYQGAANHDVSLKQTALDTGIGMGLGAGLEGLSKINFGEKLSPTLSTKVKAISNDLEVNNKYAADLAEAEDLHHAATQIDTLNRIYTAGKAANEDTTLGSAFKSWANAADEMHSYSNLGKIPTDRDISPPIVQVAEVLLQQKLHTTDIDTIANILDMKFPNVSSETLDKLRETYVKTALSKVKDVEKERKAEKGFSGALEFAETQNAIQDATKDSPLLNVFKSDVSKLPPKLREALGVSNSQYWGSRASSLVEGFLPMSEMAREIQFNKISDILYGNAKENFANTLENAKEFRSEKASDMSGHTSSTLDDIAKMEVARARYSASNYTVENLEELSKQLGEVRSGKSPKEDLFSGSMYNAQQRKFGDSSEESLTGQIDKVSKQIKQTLKLALTKKSLSDTIMTKASVGYVLADIITGTVESSILGAGATAIGTGVAGLATKRAIDGAVIDEAVKAYRLIRDDSFARELENKLYSKRYNTVERSPEDTNSYDEIVSQNFLEKEDVDKAVDEAIKDYYKGLMKFIDFTVLNKATAPIAALLGNTSSN